VTQATTIGLQKRSLRIAVALAGDEQQKRDALDRVKRERTPDTPHRLNSPRGVGPAPFSFNPAGGNVQA
jgi:hypothetical protein